MTARARAKRSSDAVRRLLASAAITSEGSPTVKVVVSFTAEPFLGGLHQIYDAEYIKGASDRELANILAWSLRQSVREKLKRRPSAPNY
jgi:hypothetical protein